MGTYTKPRRWFIIATLLGETEKPFTWAAVYTARESPSIGGRGGFNLEVSCLISVVWFLFIFVVADAGIWSILVVGHIPIEQRGSRWLLYVTGLVGFGAPHDESGYRTRYWYMDSVG